MAMSSGDREGTSFRWVFMTWVIVLISVSGIGEGMG